MEVDIDHKIRYHNQLKKILKDLVEQDAEITVSIPVDAYCTDKQGDMSVDITFEIDNPKKVFDFITTSSIIDELYRDVRLSDQRAKRQHHSHHKFQQIKPQDVIDEIAGYGLDHSLIHHGFAVVTQQLVEL